MVIEGLGLANDSNLGSAPLWRPPVAAQWIAVINDRMHSDQAGKGDTQRTDDLPAHCFGHGGCSTRYSVCPSYAAGIIKEDVAAFWAEQPFDLGMNSDYGNCDLCWKKNEAKLIRTIQEAPSKVIWWSGTEERFGQISGRTAPTTEHWPGQRTSAQDKRTSTTWAKTLTAFAATDGFHQT